MCVPPAGKLSDSASTSSHAGGAQPGPPETRPRFATGVNTIRTVGNGGVRNPGRDARMSPGSAPSGSNGLLPGISVGDPGAREKATPPAVRQVPGSDQSNA